ncbi:Nn.00g011250.m01.CDS01 [Neocucurbitaria sp. VM-36]
MRIITHSTPNPLQSMNPQNLLHTHTRNMIIISQPTSPPTPAIPASNLGTFPFEHSLTHSPPPTPQISPDTSLPTPSPCTSRMSYLLHGSTAHTGMGWVDRVPRAGNLYIGGLYALYQTDLIRAAGITHVLSVIDYDALLREKFAHLTQFHIQVDDHPNVDLLRYFEEGVGFIEGGLRGGRGDGGGSKRSSSDRNSSSEAEKRREDDGGEDAGGSGGGGGVFVHCAMGKSRSATLVVAYLIWKYHLDPTTALAQLCEGRPVCDPNPGFKEQLLVWEKMCQTESEEEKKAIYEEWEKTRFRGEYWEWAARANEMKAKL